MWCPRATSNKRMEAALPRVAIPEVEGREGRQPYILGAALPGSSMGSPHVLKSGDSRLLPTLRSGDGSEYNVTSVTFVLKRLSDKHTTRH